MRSLLEKTIIVSFSACRSGRPSTTPHCSRWTPVPLSSQLTRGHPTPGAPSPRGRTTTSTCYTTYSCMMCTRAEQGVYGTSWGGIANLGKSRCIGGHCGSSGCGNNAVLHGIKKLGLPDNRSTSLVSITTMVLSLANCQQCSIQYHDQEITDCQVYGLL